MDTNVQAEVTGYLGNLLKAKTQHLDPEMGLIATGVMDSLDIISLVEFIEERFAVKLTDEEMVPANFETIITIAAMLARKLG